MSRFDSGLHLQYAPITGSGFYPVIRNGVENAGSNPAWGANFSVCLFMTKTAEQIVEEAIGELYRGFFKMRQAKQYQTEYDAMGALLNMLMKDRDHLRKKYNIST